MAIQVVDDKVKVEEPKEAKAKKAKKPGALDKVFHYSDRGSTAGREIGAGIAAFFIAVCALLMNTKIIGEAYGTYAGAYLAAALVAFIGTVVLGLLCNLPLVQNANMGLSTVLIAMMSQNAGLTYQNMMAITFVAAVIYLIIVLTPAREVLVKALPDGVKKALPAAAGLYIILMALKNAGIISDAGLTSASTLTTLDKFYFWLMAFGTVLYFVLKAARAKRPILRTFGILVALMWVCGIIFFMDQFIGGQTAAIVVYQRVNLVMATDGAKTYNFAGALASLNIGSVFSQGFDFSAYEGSVLLLFVKGVLAFLFLGLYTNLGYTEGAAVAGDYADADYYKASRDKVLVVGAIMNVIAPILGSAPTTVGAQSAVSSEEGGKTGLTSLVAAIGFLIAMFSWIFFMFFATGTNGVGMWIEETETKLAAYVNDTFWFADLAMIFGAAAMLKGLARVRAGRPSEMAAFAATIIGSGLMGNIAFGVALGTIAAVITSLLCKDERDSRPMPPPADRPAPADRPEGPAPEDRPAPADRPEGPAPEDKPNLAANIILAVIMIVFAILTLA